MGPAHGRRRADRRRRGRGRGAAATGRRGCRRGSRRSRSGGALVPRRREIRGDVHAGVRQRRRDRCRRRGRCRRGRAAAALRRRRRRRSGRRRRWRASCGAIAGSKVRAGSASAALSAFGSSAPACAAASARAAADAARRRAGRRYGRAGAGRQRRRRGRAGGSEKSDRLRSVRRVAAAGPGELVHRARAGAARSRRSYRTGPAPRCASRSRRRRCSPRTSKLARQRLAAAGRTGRRLGAAHQRLEPVLAGLAAILVDWHSVPNYSACRHAGSRRTAHADVAAARCEGSMTRLKAAHSRQPRRRRWSPAMPRDAWRDCGAALRGGATSTVRGARGDAE